LCRNLVGLTLQLFLPLFLFFLLFFGHCATAKFERLDVPSHKELVYGLVSIPLDFFFFLKGFLTPTFLCGSSFCFSLFQSSIFFFKSFLEGTSPCLGFVQPFGSFEQMTTLSAPWASDLPPTNIGRKGFACALNLHLLFVVSPTAWAVLYFRCHLEGTLLECVNVILAWRGLAVS